MNVREKLLELLGNIYLPMMDGHDTIGEYNIPHKFKEKIADYLIAHGVTVQEWLMVDLCATCDIPERDYDPSDPECFCCSECSCYRCIYLHCCEGQCAEGGVD